MKYLNLLLKGFVIGIAKIIPGVSGAILAISFGVYERILYIISNIRKIRLNDLKFLFFLLVGAMVGIGTFCRCVKWFLDNFYLPTMLLFIGLIIGGFSEIYTEIKKDKFSFKNAFIFFTSFLLLIFLTNLNVSGKDIDGNYFIYFIMGFLESCTTIIPGISGTAIFMAFGWYNNLLELFEGMVSFNFHLGPSICFFMGVIICTFLLSKILTYLFNHFKASTYFSISGFMAGSIFIMFEDIFPLNFSLGELLIGICLFIFGVFITRIINNFFSKD